MDLLKPITTVINITLSAFQHTVLNKQCYLLYIISYSLYYRCVLPLKVLVLLI